jgi:hypothetical protein
MLHYIAITSVWNKTHARSAKNKSPSQLFGRGEVRDCHAPIGRECVAIQAECSAGVKQKTPARVN